MNRFPAVRLPLGLMGLVSVLLSLPGTAFGADAAAPHRPNVLFVLTEDQGAQLSYLDTPGLETPHMDRIARGGVYFNRGYVNYPVCSPSKAAIYTGTYPHTSGLVNNTQNFFVPAEKLTAAQRNSPVYGRVQIADRFATMTELLSRAGYYTAVSGKLHVAPNEKFPYDEWFKPNNRERTAKMLKNAEAAGKPFFFFCNIQAPHRPFRNSDKVEIGVDPSAVELPAFLPDTPVTRKDWAEYLDYTQVADAQLGEVLAALDAAGVTDDTLIVFMGDHGPAYHRAKMTLYQWGLHVPVAITGPGVPGGRRTDEMISGVDILPTLLDLLGLPQPENPIQGLSLAPLVRGEEEATGRAYVFAEVIHQGQSRDDGMQERSVFDGRFKLIYRENADKPRDVNSDLKYWEFSLPDGRNLPWHNRVYQEIVEHKNRYPDAYRMLTEIDPQTYGVTLPEFELYDTDADPEELNNLADEPAYADELTRLRSILSTWVDVTEDRFVSPGQIVAGP